MEMLLSLTLNIEMKGRPMLNLLHLLNSWARSVVAIGLVALLAGCAVESGQASPRSAGPSREAAQVDPRVGERLQRIMVPLLQKMDHPLPVNKVQVGLMDDPGINAANAGGGEFYVTTGLLQQANDDQLRAVLAHEVAHADLGHVAKQQTRGTVATIGAIILDAVVPGSGYVTPLAGQIVLNKYSREAEYQADAHGVEILRRAGFDGRQMMADTLTWLRQTAGPGSGGWFATHPATDDRIQRVQNMP